jgi:hypothetical protein
VTITADPTRAGADSHPERDPRLLSVEIDGETVVYDRVADAVHRLDSAATAVWRRLDGVAALESIADDLAREHPADLLRVHQDVLAVACVMWNTGLLLGAPRSKASRRLPDAPYVPELTDCLPENLPETPYVSRGVTALRHSFRIATNDLNVHRFLQGVFADLPDSAHAGARYQLINLGPECLDGGQPSFVLGFDGESVIATSWLPRVLAVLLWHVNREAVRTSAGEYVPLHAAAAVRHGIGVLLPAPTERGKTTTIAGLIQAGFGYLTDEVAAIDPQSLLIEPFPKALSIDRGSWAVLADLRPPDGDPVTGQWQVPPESIRAGAVASPTPVRLVVAPSYRRAEPTALHPVSRAEGLVMLIDSTFGFRDAPARNLEVLTRIVEGSDCFRLVIDDLDAAVELVDDLVKPFRGLDSEEFDVAER